MSDLAEDNVRLLQTIARLNEELRTRTEEKAVLLNIINSDCPPPADYSDLGVWIDQISQDFIESRESLTTNTEFSMWLHDWLCHIRATRQLGMDFDEEDLDG